MSDDLYYQVIFLVLSGDGSMIATKIVMATSTLIGNVASAMGQAVEKSSKVSEFCSVFVFSFQLLMLHLLFM
jgi:hypothetical protein